jgi:hypothetical protein
MYIQYLKLNYQTYTKPYASSKQNPTMATNNKRNGKNGSKNSKNADQTLIDAAFGKEGKTKTGPKNGKKGTSGKAKAISTTADEGDKTPTASGTTWFAPQYDDNGKTSKFLVKPSLIRSINERKGGDDKIPRWTKMRGAAVKTSPFLSAELQDENFRNTTAITATALLHKNSINEVSYRTTLCTKLIQIIALGRENGKTEKSFVQLVTRFAKTPPEALPGYSQVGDTIRLNNDPFTEYWIGSVNAIGGEYLTSGKAKSISTISDKGNETQTVSGMAWFSPKYNDTGKTNKFLVKPLLIPSIKERKGNTD